MALTSPRPPKDWGLVGHPRRRGGSAPHPVQNQRSVDAVLEGIPKTNPQKPKSAGLAFFSQRLAAKNQKWQPHIAGTLVPVMWWEGD